MKQITTTQLKQMIKEELQNQLVKEADEKLATAIIKGKSYDLFSAPWKSEIERGEGGIKREWVIKKNGKEIGHLVDWGTEGFGLFFGHLPNIKRYELKRSDVKIVNESKQSLKEGRFDANRLTKLLKTNKTPPGSAELFANGKHYSFDIEGIEAPYTVWGQDEDGGDHEIKIKDIEFVTINGKRIS